VPKLRFSLVLLPLLACAQLKSEPTSIALAILTGKDEIPPVDTMGVAYVELFFNPNTSELSGGIFNVFDINPTVLTIHCCEPFGTDSPIALSSPGGDLADPAAYDPAFLAAHGGTATGAEAAFLNGLDNLMVFGDINNGEIRGYFEFIPEPRNVTLLGLGFLGIALLRRKTARSSLAQKS
jgi:hypothetical protein